jgi:hypothetical protein
LGEVHCQYAFLCIDALLSIDVHNPMPPIWYGEQHQVEEENPEVHPLWERSVSQYALLCIDVYNSMSPSWGTGTGVNGVIGLFIEVVGL